MNKQIVIPVFYQVNPSDVRKQTGSFKDAFAKLKQVSGEELQTWREALTEASNLSGWDSSVTRPESRLVDEIVKDVLKKLNDMFASTDFRGERSRLHGHEDVCQVLRRNSGTEAVKGLLLDMSKIKNIDLSSQAFENMCNLRFLKLNVEQLWEGEQHVPRLKRLILGRSQQLTRIPDLSESLRIIKQMTMARKKYQKEVCVSICYPGRYHEYSHGKLSMGDLASFKATFKAPEDSSPRIPLREPEIIQTSVSDEKFDSTNQDLVPDPQTIPEKKLTLFINNKVVPFYRILRHKVGLWLFYCWIFLVRLFCGLCIFGMLVFLVLQLSTRCETYLSSHVHGGS
ncbi:hypothetical protein QYF36_008332 [Acer negundo]|nr:hypothetical protein QYF36_008332 [Acer negundo]